MDIIQHVVDAAARTEVVVEADAFRRQFKTRKTTRETMLGGLKNGDPTIWVSKAARYHDRGAWLEKISTFNTTKRGWVDCYDFARLGLWYHPEYAHILRRKDIGSFVSQDWQLQFGAAIAHEVAHAAQHWNRYLRWRSTRASGVSADAYDDFKAHGRHWQQCYAVLRADLFQALGAEHVGDVFTQRGTAVPMYSL